MRLNHIIAFSALGLVVTIAAVEAGVRLSGLTDFPLYDADAEIGYIPKPNQHGSFLNKNDWAFNEHSMATAEPFAPSVDRDVLLIGDSVVLGGNPLASLDRLGPMLANATGAHVWPVSAGSWGLQNELTYLRQHPEVVASVDDIMMVLNSGDFGLPSSWSSESTHPRTRPISGLLYAFKKYVLPRKPPTYYPYPVAIDDWRDDFAELCAKRPVHVFLYPTKPESGDHSQLVTFHEWQELLLDLGAANVTRVADDQRWGSPDFYRDGIHPSPAGNKILAAILADDL